MKKFLLASLFLFSGCVPAINVSNNNTLKIIKVEECTSDNSYYYYKIRDKDSTVHYFFSNEKFLVGDSVKIVKVEQDAEISSDPK